MCYLFDARFLNAFFADNTVRRQWRECPFSLDNFSLVIFQFPVLCAEFFKLTTYICEMYPAKMSLLPEALFKNLMASLEVGLTKYPF